MAFTINKRKQTKKSVKKSSVRRASSRISPAKPAQKSKPLRVWRPTLPNLDSTRFTMFVYWAIILFFVSATFYIIGYTNSFMNRHHQMEDVEISIIDMSGMTHYQRAELALQFLSTGRDNLLSGNIAGAIIDLTVSIDADPSNPFPFIYRGEAHMQVGNLTRAFNDFTESIAIDPDNSVAWYNRAIIQVRQENFNSAIADLTQARAANEVRPSAILSNRDIYARRGQLNLWRRNFQAAVNDYTAAINVGRFGANPDDFAGRAEAYTGLGAFSLAAADYLTAITLISERIQNAFTQQERELMSRQAIQYFEKSAALRVQMSDFIEARDDLESAITIATALGDFHTIERLRTLLGDM